MDRPTDKLAQRASPSGGAYGMAEGFTRAVIEATTFQAFRRILRATIAAKWNLGLDATDDCHELAHMSYHGPTIVSAVRIVGWREEPMYDEHPDIDFASFRRPLIKLIELMPGTLEDARTAFRRQEVLDAWFGSWNRRELPPPTEPASTIARVELLDNLGNVVAEADFGSDTDLHWRPTPIMTGIDITSALGRADELERIAAFEAGWDNFSIAEDLREQAAALRRQVSIAQHAPRLAARAAEGQG
jgi:hypothetical protein